MLGWILHLATGGCWSIARSLHEGLCGKALNSLKQLKEVSRSHDGLQAAALAAFSIVNWLWAKNCHQRRPKWTSVKILQTDSFFISWEILHIPIKRFRSWAQNMMKKLNRLNITQADYFCHLKVTQGISIPGLYIIIYKNIVFQWMQMT